MKQKRVCKTCKIKKSLSDFEKQHGKWYRRECKKCRKEYYCRTYFGMTAEDYELEFNKLFNLQKGKCYLCEKSDIPLRLDHSHKTGKIRSLLCDGCNLFAGKVENNLDFVNKIIKYLEDFNG